VAVASLTVQGFLGPVDQRDPARAIPALQATFLVLADRLSLFIEFWPLVIGVIFMAFVLFLPRGIWGTLTSRRAP